MLKRRSESRYTGFVLGRWALRVLCIGGAALFQTSLALGQTSSSNLASTGVKIVSTEFKYEPATLHVATGRSVTVILDNTQAETEHGIFIFTRGDHICSPASISVASESTIG
jgi:plastocyanin